MIRGSFRRAARALSQLHGDSADDSLRGRLLKGIHVEAPRNFLEGTHAAERPVEHPMSGGRIHSFHSWAGKACPRDSVPPRSGSWMFVRHATRVQGYEVRVGSIIERKGRMMQVLKTQHTQQGRGGATIQVELRDVQSGLKSTERLRTTEVVDLVFVDDKKFTFLYSDAESAVLMEPDTFEQVTVPVAFFGSTAPLLREGMEVTVHHFNSEPLSASLPARVSDVVAQADPYFKGQTATAMYKKAVLRSGLQIQVPPFVVEGDEIVVQTADLTYVTRVKAEKS